MLILVIFNHQIFFNLILALLWEISYIIDRVDYSVQSLEVYAKVSAPLGLHVRLTKPNCSYKAQGWDERIYSLTTPTQAQDPQDPKVARQKQLQKNRCLEDAIFGLTLYKIYLI